MPKRVLLIDADVLAYNAASACEKAVDWGDGYWTWSCDFAEVLVAFDAALNTIVEALGGEPVLCLTDSTGNFRFGVLPTYKGNRRQKKPLVLRALKEYLIAERGAYFRPGLEGDDCMGILMTRKNPDQEERVIVSIDKDMKTIPGLVCRWPIEQAPRLIPEWEADYWHLYQTLTGDSTDGYMGCPKMGPVTAKALLDECFMSGTFEPDYAWSCVVAAYEKAKLTEEDALVQARVARILRASDYDFKKKEPILWTP